nr:MAG TPA: putative transposon-related DNA-binding protein [Caudoviricetes sp.]
MWLEALKKMKKISGKTSKQISEETNIPKSTIDKLFAGQTKEPYLVSTRAIVHCMGFTLDDLYDFENSQSYTQEEKTIINNYRNLNEKGKQKLFEYSDDLICSGNYNKVYKIKTAAMDGSFKETTVTDDDLNKLMNLPDVDDLK